MNEKIQSPNLAHDLANAEESARRAAELAGALALEQEGYIAPDPTVAAEAAMNDIQVSENYKAIPQIKHEISRPLSQAITERAAKIGLVMNGYRFDRDPKAQLSDEAFHSLSDLVGKVRAMSAARLDPAQTVNSWQVESPHTTKLRNGVIKGFDPDVVDAAASGSYSRALTFLGVDANSLEVAPVEPIATSSSVDSGVKIERRVVPTEFPGISLQQDTTLEDKPHGREFIGLVPRSYELTLVPTPNPVQQTEHLAA